jgi:hypothetical protein
MSFTGQTNFHLPTKGLLFISPVGTELFDVSKVDPLVPSTYQGWTAFDASRQEGFEPTIEGGTINRVGTSWYQEKRIFVEPTYTGFKSTIVQLDQDAFKIAFPTAEISPDGSQITVDTISQADHQVVFLAFENDKYIGIRFFNAAVNVNKMFSFKDFSGKDFLGLEITGSSQVDAVTGKTFQFLLSPESPIKPVAPSVPVYTGTDVATLKVGENVTGEYKSATGTEPITYRVNTGGLPDGLTLSSDGNLTGSPTKAGTFDFTVIGENEAGSSPKLNVKAVVSSTESPVSKK